MVRSQRLEALSVVLARGHDPRAYSAQAGEVEGRDYMLAVWGVGLDGRVGGNKIERVVFQPDDETRWARAASPSCTHTRSFIPHAAGFERVAVLRQPNLKILPSAGFTG